MYTPPSLATYTSLVYIYKTPYILKEELKRRHGKQDK